MITIYDPQKRADGEHETVLDNNSTINFHANGKDFRVKLVMDGKWPTSVKITEVSGSVLEIEPKSTNQIIIK